MIYISTEYLYNIEIEKYNEEHNSMIFTNKEDMYNYIEHKYIDIEGDSVKEWNYEFENDELYMGYFCLEYISNAWYIGYLCKNFCVGYEDEIFFIMD